MLRWNLYLSYEYDKQMYRKELLASLLATNAISFDDVRELR